VNASRRDGTRAGAVVNRIRNLIKKAPPSDDRADINPAIHEVIELTRSEALKNRVSVRTELVEGLPLVQGDRVVLQQFVLNLMINAIEAMSGMSQGPRQLIVSTDKTEAGGARPRFAIRFPDSRKTCLRLSKQPVDLSFDLRAARRSVVGERQPAARRRLSIHVTVPCGRRNSRLTLLPGRSSKPGKREGPVLALRP
jgi:hypothetical protein